MATDLAPTAPISQPRQYWQLPLFAVGLAAAILAYRYFPLQAGPKNEHLERDRYNLQQVLDRKPLNLPELKDAVAKVGSHTGQGAKDTSTLFAIGSAHVALAELDTAKSAEYWQAAEEYLSGCKAKDLTDAQDKLRLAFRLAKANAASGRGDPKATLEALDNLPINEEHGSRLRLVAETCLRLNPPDVKRAKAELSAYLSGPPRGTVAEATKLRLQLADLCVKTGESDRAQAWLREVSEQAPPDLLAVAKIQLAQLLMNNRNVNEAVKLFEATEQLPGVSAEQRSLVRYQTGYGLMGLGNAKAAASYLTKSTETGGPAARAAFVRLTELNVKNGSWKEADECLQAATNGIKSPAEWTNPHVSLAELRKSHEATVQGMKQKGDFEAASVLLTRYATIAEGTKDKELFAELLADWANAKDVADPRGKLTQAGAEYVKLAVARKQDVEQARYYELAHSAYTAAGDTVQAEDVLKKLSALPGARPEQLASLNLKKAQQLLQEEKYTEASTLLKDLSKTPGGLGLRASVKWAFAEVKCGLIQLNEPSTEADGRLRIKDGLRVLTEVANNSYEAADEKLAHEEALYKLARFLIERNLPDVMNLADAEGRFRRLLREYPKSDYSEKSKLFLGITLCALAQSKTPGGAIPANATTRLTEAKELFQALGTSADDWTRVHADIRLLQSMLYLKQYDALIDEAKTFAKKYQGTVMELVVLNLQYVAYNVSQRPDLAESIKESIRDKFEKLPDTAYRTDMIEFTKAHWKKVFGVK
jgi:hypothetical protein